MTTGQLQLPNVRVQESAYEVLTDIESGKIESEEFWVEVNGREARFQASRQPHFKSNLHGVSAVYMPAAKELDLYESSKAQEIVRFGDVLATIPSEWGRITDGDISSSQAILATDSGEVKLLNFNNPTELEEQLSGHRLHASLARFFPSGKVAISAGMDYSMKLWDLQSGSQIRTLTSQTGLIDDIVFLGKGRNLLSLSQASSDVVLWEVSQTEVIHKFKIPQLRCIGMWTDKQAGSVSEESEPLYEAHNKVVFAGTQTSTLVLDLRSPENKEVHLPEPSEQLCITGNTLVRSCGSNVAITDLRFPGSDVLHLVSVQGPVSHLQVTPSKAYVGTANSVHAYDFSSKAKETLCTEPQGVLREHDGDLWHIGGGVVRHFTL